MITGQILAPSSSAVLAFLGYSNSNSNHSIIGLWPHHHQPFWHSSAAPANMINDRSIIGLWPHPSQPLRLSPAHPAIMINGLRPHHHQTLRLLSIGSLQPSSCPSASASIFTITTILCFGSFFITTFWPIHPDSYHHHHLAYYHNFAPLQK